MKNNKQDAWESKNGYSMPVSEQDLWIIDIFRSKDTPKQTNKTDCGVLQMLTIAYISDGLPLLFDCITDVPNARRRIAYELILDELFDETEL